MKKTHLFRFAAALGLLSALLAVPAQGWAQAISAGASAAAANGVPIGQQFVISGDPEQEVYPSMAYNSQRQEYLVVWYNDRPGNDDIRAQRLSRNGALIGGPFYISTGPGADRRYPDVAYNTQQDQYLVVWEHYDNASLVPGYGIYGRRVSGTGAVLDASDIIIQSNGGNLATPATPAVAYASTTDNYLVVWAEAWHPMPIAWDIYGQVVSSSGALDGSQFSISKGNEEREQPDVAYNRHANRYLVVWQQKAGTLWDVHGQQVHGGGGLYQGDITIAAFANSSTAPSVAALPISPTNDKFLVVWEAHYAPGDRNIYGRPVAEDGTPGLNFFAYSWEIGVDESSPAVAGSESNPQYFVVWRHPQGVVDKPIKGRAISYAGAPVSQQEAEFSGVNADHPAVAYGPTGDFLAAWQDQPVWATNTNIYGQLWGNRVYLPLIVK